MNAITAILIAAISFSFYPLLNTIALESVSTYVLATCVQVITALLSFILLVINLGSLTKTKDVLVLFWKLPWDLKLIPVLSGTGIFAGGLFFISALELMTKTGATLIMECWPFLAILIARSLLTHKQWEPFKALDALLILMAFLGLVSITASESGLSYEQLLDNPTRLIDYGDLNQLLGILLAVLSAVCFAWAGVSRSYFSSRLPEKFRIYFFKKKDSLAESNFTYMLTYVLGLPIAFLCYYLLGTDEQSFDAFTIPVMFIIGTSLVITSMFYSYALLIANNANINLLWYIAPLLATVWLIIFGYSTLTPLIITGGGLIILANLILILTSNDKKAKKA